MIRPHLCCSSPPLLLFSILCHFIIFIALVTIWTYLFMHLSICELSDISLLDLKLWDIRDFVSLVLYVRSSYNCAWHTGGPVRAQPLWSGNVHSKGRGIQTWTLTCYQLFLKKILAAMGPPRRNSVLGQQWWGWAQVSQKTLYRQPLNWVLKAKYNVLVKEIAHAKGWSWVR